MLFLSVCHFNWLLSSLQSFLESLLMSLFDYLFLFLRQPYVLVLFRLSLLFPFLLPRSSNLAFFRLLIVIITRDSSSPFLPHNYLILIIFHFDAVTFTDFPHSSLPIYFLEDQVFIRVKIELVILFEFVFLVTLIFFFTFGFLLGIDLLWNFSCWGKLITLWRRAF